MGKINDVLYQRIILIKKLKLNFLNGTLKYNLLFSNVSFKYHTVGATLGFLIGAFAGLKTEKGFLHGAITGAANGVILSKKILEILLATWDSDDAVIASFFSLVSFMVKLVLLNISPVCSL